MHTYDYVYIYIYKYIALYYFNYYYIILYNVIIFKFKTDCERTCTTGKLNSLCTLCECDTRITGTVKVGPIGLADVEIRAVNQEWSPIAVTNTQGF